MGPSDLRGATFSKSMLSIHRSKSNRPRPQSEFQNQVMVNPCDQPLLPSPRWTSTIHLAVTRAPRSLAERHGSLPRFAIRAPCRTELHYRHVHHLPKRCGERQGSAEGHHSGWQRAKEGARHVSRLFLLSPSQRGSDVLSAAADVGDVDLRLPPLESPCLCFLKSTTLSHCCGGHRGDKILFSTASFLPGSAFWQLQQYFGWRGQHVVPFFGLRRVGSTDQAFAPSAQGHRNTSTYKHVQKRLSQQILFRAWRITVTF